MTDLDPKLLAWLYDATMQDWPGELVFYTQLAGDLLPSDNVLEIGCGTGRVSIHLAQHGHTVVGTDISSEMLELAREKSRGLAEATWVQADMRTLQLEETFALALIPGHSFQFMVTAEAQCECLSSIKAHLEPDARLIVHVNHDDLSWLAGLPREPGRHFEDAGKVQLPKNGHILQTWRAWSYERETQTAKSVNRREEIDMNGKIVNSWLSEPVALHCIFPFEFQHLASLTGFKIEALYGDFYKANLTETSDNLIYVLRNSGS